MPRTPPSSLILPGLAFTLAFAGCSPTGIDMTNAANPASNAPDARPGAGQFRRNPQPRQPYRLTMRIDNAPGPFAQVVAVAQFDVVNKECLPPPDSNPGGHTSAVPTEDIEILLERVSDTEYQGTFYADQMLDEDYYGRGVCRWELVEARVRMKATGEEGESLFMPFIRKEQVLTSEQQTNYFSKSAYPTTEGGGYPYVGRLDREHFGPTMRDSDLFTVTFTASQEAAP